MLEGRQHLLDGFVEGDGGVVDDRCSFGNDEGARFASFVDAVAFGEVVGLTLSAAAGGANFFGGVDVDLVGAVREDDAADVTSFHHQRPEADERSLIGDEARADFRHAGDEGDGGIDGIAVELVGAQIMAIEADVGLSITDWAFKHYRRKHGDDGAGIVGVDATVQHGPGEGAIHVSGAHEGVAKLLRDELRDAAFAGSGRAVDGDDCGHAEKIRD